MAEIQLKKLTKRWGNFTAVDDFNFMGLKAGEVLRKNLNP